LQDDTGKVRTIETDRKRKQTRIMPITMHGINTLKKLTDEDLQRSMAQNLNA